MGRYLRELRDALRREPSSTEETPAVSEPSTIPPTPAPEPEKAPPAAMDESKPTLMVKLPRAGVEDINTGTMTVSADGVAEGFMIVPTKMAAVPSTAEKP